MIKTKRDTILIGETFYELSQFSMWDFAKEYEYVYYKNVNNHIITYRVRKAVMIDDKTSKGVYLKKDEITNEIKNALNIF
jgi:hypothetical protein